MELLKDYLAATCIARGKQVDGYGNLYFETNENLSEIYRNIDFLDKDVLSALASSDQLFMARYMGARKVDTFDKNPLTPYYYYLRVWAVKYMNEIYPDGVLENDYDWIDKLLSRVKPRNKEEADAYGFWSELAQKRVDFNRMFFYNQPEGKMLFRTTNSIGSVIDEPLSFRHIDLFEEQDFVSKYDIAVMSNILEYARSDKKKLEIASSNLSRLLRRDGIVLCSTLINRDKEAVELEKRIFDHNFEFSKLDKGVGYTYRKR